ncbi:hypothetical protein C0J52_27502, partial [Blattella germanica]
NLITGRRERSFTNFLEEVTSWHSFRYHLPHKEQKSVRRLLVSACRRALQNSLLKLKIRIAERDVTRTSVESDSRVRHYKTIVYTSSGIDTLGSSVNFGLFISLEVQSVFALTLFCELALAETEDGCGECIMASEITELVEMEWNREEFQRKSVEFTGRSSSEEECEERRFIVNTKYSHGVLSLANL